jgi:HNH endonuclease
VSATVSAYERVLRRVKITDAGCWLWTGRRTSGGYGQIRSGSRGSRMVYVHRVTYEAEVGPIPSEMKIDHICHNVALARGECAGGVTCRHRACVNPAHLEVVTQRVNLLRGNTGPASNASKTHCVNGHPFSGPNLIQRKSGVRECRTCANGRRRKAGPPTIWVGESDSVFRDGVRAEGA